MMQVQQGADGKNVLTLPAVLDLTVAESLKNELQSVLSRSEALDIDASQVQRATSPCLQVLISAMNGFAQAGGLPMRFSAMSEAFSEMVSVLALGSVIQESGANSE